MKKNNNDYLCLSVNLLCTLLLCALCNNAYADDDDTRRLLDSAARQIPQYVSPDFANADNAADADKFLTINGQTYRVGNSEEELSRGIYYAINDRQWVKVSEFLARYRQLPTHKKSLVLMSEGLIARSMGDYPLALQKMQAAYHLAPKDSRIQLELGRLYSEDKQSLQAQKIFSQAGENNLPESTKNIIKHYQYKLQEQQKLHGVITVGIGYNDNINQGNGKETCTFRLAGQCIMTRSLPKAIGSNYLNYQALFSKRIALGGHHNLLIRPLIYGKKYKQRDNSRKPSYNFSDNTALIYFGYEYLDAKNRWAILPNWEHYYQNGHANYHAPGISFEWNKQLTPRWAIGGNVDIKRFLYLGEEKKFFSNFNYKSMGITGDFALTAQTYLNARVDYRRRSYQEATASNKEYAVGLGLFTRLNNNFELNLMLSHQQTRYDAKSFLSTQPRKDKRNLATISIAAKKWRLGYFYPELMYQYTNNKSNIDLYDYRQDKWLLNLKTNF